MSDSESGLSSFHLLNALPETQQVDLLRALVDAIPDAIVAHGPDGELVFWSNGLCDLLGYTRDEIRALKPFGWVEPEAMRGAPGRLETILYDGNLTFESRALRKDGSVVPTLVTARRIDTRMGPLVVSVMRDITALKLAQGQLSFLANHDGLTGVSSRQAFETRVSVAIADAHRHGDNVAIAHLDLDGFRSINDAHGYQVGDGVLVAVAKRLADAVREQDVVSRLGSDEFVILLSRVRSPDELGVVADRLLGSVSEPIDVSGIRLQLTATLGFAVLDLEADDLHSLVFKADAAMYTAKRDPQRSWLVWSDDLGTPPAPAR